MSVSKLKLPVKTPKDLFQRILDDFPDRFVNAWVVAEDAKTGELVHFANTTEIAFVCVASTSLAEMARLSILGRLN